MRLIKNDICTVQAIVSAILHAILCNCPGTCTSPKQVMLSGYCIFFFGSDWTRWFPMLNNYDSMLFILFAVVNFLFFCHFSHHTLRKLLVKLKKTLPLLFHLWVTLKDLSYINYSMSMYFLFPLSHNAYRIPTLLRLLICSKCSYPGKKQYWMWQQSSAFECMKVVTSEIWVGKIDLLNWLPQNNFKNPHGFPTQKIC